ncbi:magnesium/cobalt transporter CorA [Segetibacter sp. 3557_3]|uniref:magnesium/cobalt transporter CorA n=1 Tax=Segetibacter sp. 3557_3 TaxID=2547429 RepID=UPI001058DF8D|nr:magnesium/cobalt transporter CorA [Segetibacter sp. 3557_3]TDH25188.1 magnesium/cobalt transporter CorA [Segetibacter sp. 3557_3]
MRPDRYLKQFIFPEHDTHRTAEIFIVNPTVAPMRQEADRSRLYVYDYDANTIDHKELADTGSCYIYKHNNRTTWLNIDGIRKQDVEEISRQYGIHNLLVEDILSIGQRPKVDEIEGIMYCLLNMLYFNEEECAVEQEQVSIVLGENFVITFQEDEHRDVFNPVREKLKLHTSKIRQRSADYLCYALLDMIVDQYFVVMEKLGEKIETLEEDIIRHGNTSSFGKINDLRKELIVLKRNVSPVRDLVNGFIKSETELIDDNTTKYFKDVYDHIVQANDFVENYRDMMTNLHDLYISKVNLRMNEVMKVLAIVTCLLAPATVIGGIFGMNFDVIPYAHQVWGFYATVILMLVIPLVMLIIFKRRGWFN